MQVKMSMLVIPLNSVMPETHAGSHVLKRE